MADMSATAPSIAEVWSFATSFVASSSLTYVWSSDDMVFTTGE